jgi:ribonuclease BN (tRNA processing enzyme)
MASRAGAGAVVLTHIAPARDARPAAQEVIARNYKGPIFFAEDLQAF